MRGLLYRALVLGQAVSYVLACRYASGATVQILLFGILAIEVKRKAPTAHTILEIVRARWGTAAHLTFLFFCLLTNCIVRLQITSPCAAYRVC